MEGRWSSEAANATTVIFPTRTFAPNAQNFELGARARSTWEIQTSNLGYVRHSISGIQSFLELGARAQSTLEVQTSNLVYGGTGLKFSQWGHSALGFGPGDTEIVNSRHRDVMVFYFLYVIPVCVIVVVLGGNRFIVPVILTVRYLVISVMTHASCHWRWGNEPCKASFSNSTIFWVSVIGAFLMMVQYTVALFTQENVEIDIVSVRGDTQCPAPQNLHGRIVMVASRTG